jgi:hypothetical protein
MSPDFDPSRPMSYVTAPKSHKQNPLAPLALNAIRTIAFKTTTMASKQPGPHIPSESIASKLEKPKDGAKTAKKEHLDAKPGPVILSEEQAAKLEKAPTKEELQRRAKEMNE